MKIKPKKREPYDPFFDGIITDLAKKDYTEVSKDIHSNILKTVEKCDRENTSSNNSIKHNKNKGFSFKDNFNIFVKMRLQTVSIGFLSLIIITTGAVGARQMSKTFFNKDTVKLDTIGITNEFIFTDNLEQALKQNVPLELVTLDDNYFININSVLVDEINFFVVFELHSKTNVSDDLQFCIKDLVIKDENNEQVYYFDNEKPDSINKGYKNIYNTSNSIKQLFFMFGNDSSKLKKLNFSFSKIEIYRYNTKINDTNSKSTNVNIEFPEKNITVPLAKENYSTIQEYNLDTSNNNFSIEKAILNNTGLYILTHTPTNIFTITLKYNDQFIKPAYQLPLKRCKNSGFQMLLVYDIKDADSTYSLYNSIDKKIYNLVPIR